MHLRGLLKKVGVGATMILCHGEESLIIQGGRVRRMAHRGSIKGVAVM